MEEIVTKVINEEIIKSLKTGKKSKNLTPFKEKELTTNQKLYKKIILRLKDLYISRKNIRYADTNKINEWLAVLAEYRYRIQEIENLLDFETIKKLKIELNIDD